MMENKSSVEAVVAGHICLDITPKFSGSVAAGTALSEVLVPGKLISMEGVEISSGGAVSNTGIALSLLGVPTSLMGKVGQDPFGGILKGIVSDYGAGDALKPVEGQGTSYTVILVPPGIDRIFLHDAGANNSFTAEDINYDEVAQAKLFHFGYPPIMERMFQGSGEELKGIFKRVKESGVTTAMDMALPDINSPAGKANWPEILSNVLPYTDIFLPSLEEIFLMLDRKRYIEYGEAQKGKDFVEDLDMGLVEEMGARLIDLGVKVAVIKCGHHGLYAKTAPADALKAMGRAAPADTQGWADRELFSESFRVDDLLSATGAGDNAVAGFLAGLLREKSLEGCLETGCAAGARATRSYSALGATVSLKELEKDLSGNAQGGAPKNRAPIDKSGTGVSGKSSWVRDDAKGLWEKG